MAQYGIIVIVHMVHINSEMHFGDSSRKIVSHHVHHSKSDQPGDPYNAQAGFLYCFLADVNHQPISKNLTQQDYNRVKSLMQHTGVPANTYEQYLKWGSYVNPVYAMISWLLNWSFWYFTFYMMGGHALACSLFGAAGFWTVGVRTFNYEGHAKGKDKQRDGTDYSVKDKSINQIWTGIVAGEWHNNHHLFPKSARSGFKPYQIDLAWYYIKLKNKLGAVKKYRDDKKLFYDATIILISIQKKTQNNMERSEQFTSAIEGSYLLSRFNKNHLMQKYRFSYFCISVLFLFKNIYPNLSIEMLHT
jgi:stearoyl-CoA desaturase (delta-9 desaturase)